MSGEIAIRGQRGDDGVLRYLSTDVVAMLRQRSEVARGLHRQTGMDPDRVAVLPADVVAAIGWAAVVIALDDIADSLDVASMAAVSGWKPNAEGETP